MTTKTTAELTLFDRISRLTFLQAARLLGPEGQRLINAGGKYEIDIDAQVELGPDAFRLVLDAATVTLSLSPAAPKRLQWHCDACQVPCEHAGAALALILEEKLALGLAAAPPEREAVASLGEEALIAQALAERQERARTEKIRSGSGRTTRSPVRLRASPTGSRCGVGSRASRTARARTIARTPSAPASTSCTPWTRYGASFPPPRTESATASATWPCTWPTARNWSCGSCCRSG